jgi:hypothetical protein
MLSGCDHLLLRHRQRVKEGLHRGLAEANGDILTVRRAFFEGAQRAAIAFSPDGRLLAVQNSQAGRGGVLLLSLDANDLDRQLCERLTSEPTQQTWSAILPNDNPLRACGAKIIERRKTRGQIDDSMPVSTPRRRADRTAGLITALSTGRVRVGALAHFLRKSHLYRRLRAERSTSAFCSI